MYVWSKKNSECTPGLNIFKTIPMLNVDRDINFIGIDIFVYIGHLSIYYKTQ